MKKTIMRIVSLLTVFVIMIPIVSMFSVSAADGSDEKCNVGLYYDLFTSTSIDGTGGTDLSIYKNAADETITTDGQLDLGKVYQAQADYYCASDDPDYKSWRKEHYFNTTNGYPNYPYISYVTYIDKIYHYYLIQQEKPYARFLYSLSNSKWDFSDKPIYYFSYGYSYFSSNSTSDVYIYGCSTLYSYSPFELKDLGDNLYTFSTENSKDKDPIYICSSSFCKYVYTDGKEHCPSNQYLDRLTVSEPTIPSKYALVFLGGDNLLSHIVGSTSIPSNSDNYFFKKPGFKYDFSFSNFPIDLSKAGDSSSKVGSIEDHLKDEGVLSFKDFVDVKFTPELKLKMDRTVPESTFGISEDYFSLEVTNRNDFDIQFKCYAVPENSLFIDEFSKSDELKSLASGLNVLVNTDDFIPKVPDDTIWMLEKDQWIYSKETSNQEDYDSDIAYLVNKPTSVFYIKSGKTFKQVIKWSQLNINKNQSYHMLVTACQCPYDRASDNQISLASDNYSESFKHIISESYFICYDERFSVSNPLYYDSTEKFGGVIANTGRLQVDEDYWKMNAINKNGEVEIRNADYNTAWRFNRDDVTVDGSSTPILDWDNISLSNVKNLVNDTMNYFSVISTVFSLFPVWIWTLLFAGITGLIVIGIFKALR